MLCDKPTVLLFFDSGFIEYILIRLFGKLQEGFYMPASKIIEKYGARIKELRNKKNLTQERLAEKSGLHYTYIGTVERGTKNISLKNIEKVAKGLGVSLTEFFSSFK